MTWVYNTLNHINWISGCWHIGVRKGLLTPIYISTTANPIGMIQSAVYSSHPVLNSSFFLDSHMKYL